jgi:hypothetical protein
MRKYHGKRVKNEASLWWQISAAEKLGDESLSWGYWCYDDRQTAKYLLIVIPGHGIISWCYQADDGRDTWKLSGPHDSPSLHPSLMVNRGKPDQWHGWFKKGVLEEI